MIKKPAFLDDLRSMCAPRNQEDDFMTSPQFIIRTFRKRQRVPNKRYVSCFLSQCVWRGTWAFLHWKRLNLKILALRTALFPPTDVTDFCCSFIACSAMQPLTYSQHLIVYGISFFYYTKIIIAFVFTHEPHTVHEDARLFQDNMGTLLRMDSWLNVSTRGRVLKWMTATHHKSKYLL